MAVDVSRSGAENPRLDMRSRLHLARYTLFKPRAGAGLDRALRGERRPGEIIAAEAWTAVRRLVEHAHANVPFYRERFERVGLRPADIRSPHDYPALPVLTRADVIGNFERLFAGERARRTSRIAATGGSSGTPVRIGHTRRVVREIPKWQMLSWWGLPTSADMATLYRSVPRSRVERMVTRFVAWPQRVIEADATHLDAAEVERCISAIERHRPQLIHGYAGALDTVADALLQQGRPPPRPTVVWSTAAPLTQVQEAKIQRAFGAPVCDQYGCTEAYFIAAQCPSKRGLHVFADRVWVEFVDDAGLPVPDGEYGRVVITSLDETSFPLIRYVNGDIGRFLPGTCRCGRGLPLIDKVRGRISDRLVLPDGTVLAGEYLTTIFDDHTTEVSRFQVVQRASGAVEVRVLFVDGLVNARQLSVLDTVRRELSRRIAGKVPLEVASVPEIRGERGKLQFVVRE
jgi:phenylacetate-CoA ligase